jgi:putative PIN family toxin of toxin-antitoxin system
MPKAVLDTNILVSSFILSGKPRRLLTEIARKRITLVTSEEILDEFMKAARRKRISRYTAEGQAERFVEIISRIAEIVEVKSKLKVVKEDATDDKVVNAALDAQADWIVTGDQHLLKLKEFRGVQIIAVDKALRMLRRE